MKLAFDWKIDLALLILVWRLAINPPASWWRDPAAILALFFAAFALLEKKHARVPARALTIATMVLLLALFAWRQVPLTLQALGLSE